MKKLILLFFIILLVGCTQEQVKQNDIVQQNMIMEKMVAKEGLTMDDVTIHDAPNDCWVVVENEIFDVTNYDPKDVGGDKMYESCGRDASDLFLSKNGIKVQTNLENYFIGKLN